MSTKIEWTQQPGTKGETWNPIVGCSEVSPGCRHCYAAKVAHRGMQDAHKGLTVMKPNGVHWNGTVRMMPERLEIPLRWKKPRTVFVCSMSDLFHEALSDVYIANVFEVMAACPQHTFIVLTKRAKRMREWFRHAHIVMSVTEEWPLPNVWAGVSVESSDYLSRIEELAQCPAAVRFVSAEPLLGPLDFSRIFWRTCSQCGGDAIVGRDGEACSCARYGRNGGHELRRVVDQVIIGGESETPKRARSMRISWARDIINQCKRADVSVFMKQVGTVPMVSGDEDVAANGWGQYIREEDAVDGADRTVLMSDSKGGDMDEWPHDLRVREFPRVGAGL